MKVGLPGTGTLLISKEFFNSKWIDLQGETPINKDEKFYCVFEAKDTPPQAYFFNEKRLPSNVIQKIKSWKKGGTLTFCVEEFAGGVRKTSNIRFVLE